MTYVGQENGGLISPSHVDRFARKPVGWALSTYPALKALQMAWEMRGHPKGLMFHSDQGSHYLALSIVTDYGVIKSPKV
ncbi:hypothetical protein [Providencia hangzhouensis]|uniref:hypothetical protein n=1 Tax=Providencia hangzhouensis TaxID=3031799 RepID=UPI003F68D6DD